MSSAFVDPVPVAIVQSCHILQAVVVELLLSLVRIKSVDPELQTDVVASCSAALSFRSAVSLYDSTVSAVHRQSNYPQLSATFVHRLLLNVVHSLQLLLSAIFCHFDFECFVAWSRDCCSLTFSLCACFSCDSSSLTR